MDIIITFLVCIFATTLGSLSGLGGGVIIKPVLDAALTLPSSQISFMSSCTVLAMAVASYLKTRNNDLGVNKNTLLKLALGAACGGVIGNMVFKLISKNAPNPDFITVVQNLLLTILILLIFVYLKNKAKIVTKDITNPAVIVSIGFSLGVCSAFLGIGGGPINLVAMYYFFSMKTKMAAYCSIFVILLSQSFNLGYSVLTRTVPEVNPTMLICMIAGGIAGGFIGPVLAKKYDDDKIEKIFAGAMICIVILSGYNVAKILLA